MAYSKTLGSYLGGSGGRFRTEKTTTIMKHHDLAGSVECENELQKVEQD